MPGANSSPDPLALLTYLALLRTASQALVPSVPLLPIKALLTQQRSLVLQLPLPFKKQLV
jgi:hypothetical protein